MELIIRMLFHHTKPHSLSENIENRLVYYNSTRITFISTYISECCLNTVVTISIFVNHLNNVRSSCV